MTTNTSQLQLGLEDQPKRERSGVLRSLHLQGQPTKVDQALARDRTAREQDGEILGLIREYFYAGVFTPSEVHAVLQQSRDAAGKRCPLLTSTRRAISNLTKRDHLRHWPQEKKPGPFGVDETCWSLAQKQEVAD